MPSRPGHYWNGYQYVPIRQHESGHYVPQSVEEWRGLLEGTGISPPDHTQPSEAEIVATYGQKFVDAVRSTPDLVKTITLEETQTASDDEYRTWASGPNAPDDAIFDLSAEKP